MLRHNWATIAAAVLLAGCFAPSLDATQCGDLGACPAGLTCTPQGLCAACGDGLVENGELCDDGNPNDQDDCLTDCTPNTCGDRVVDQQGPASEECDEGGIDTATCNADCTAPRCGDHHINSEFKPDGTHVELCDDGNQASGDGCSANCASVETCGDGYVNSDLPNGNGDPDHPETNSPMCLTATSTGTNCKEVCDDGNNLAGDGCSPNCLSRETCRNGILDAVGGPTSPPELCDDGNQIDSDACRNTCGTGVGCGNGVVDNDGPAGPSIDEQCDGGALLDTRDCDIDCTIPVCGDGHTNTAAAEECDPGVVGQNTATCDADCTVPFCGDGIVNLAAHEECDPGTPGVNTPACDLDCTIPRCGDMLINAAANEECDDGNSIVTDNCPYCHPARCGDGILDLQVPGIETCDDANSNNTDGCPNDCTIP